MNSYKTDFLQTFYLGKKQDEHMIRFQTFSTNVFKFSLLDSIFPEVFFDGSI